MKNFFHDANASRNYKLRKLIREHGMVGYGLWWLILEDVADHITARNLSCAVHYDLESLADAARLTTSELKPILALMVELRLLQELDGRLYCQKVLIMKSYQWAPKDNRTEVKNTLAEIEKARSKNRVFTGRGALVCGQPQIICGIHEHEHEHEHEKTSLSKFASEVSDDAEDSKRFVCPYQKIIDLYHEVLPSLPKVERANDSRKKFIKARHREPEINGDLQNWRGYFEFVSQSRFLMGLAEPSPGRKPFQANFDFLINATNYMKVLEGRYHD